MRKLVSIAAGMDDSEVESLGASAMAMNAAMESQMVLKTAAMYLYHELNVNVLWLARLSSSIFVPLNDVSVTLCVKEMG